MAGRACHKQTAVGTMKVKIEYTGVGEEFRRAGYEMWSLEALFPYLARCPREFGFLTTARGVHTSKFPPITTTGWFVAECNADCLAFATKDDVRAELLAFAHVKAGKGYAVRITLTDGKNVEVLA